MDTNGHLRVSKSATRRLPKAKRRGNESTDRARARSRPRNRNGTQLAFFPARKTCTWQRSGSGNRNAESAT